MKYYSVAEARNMPGLRSALTAGVPGPYGEAAKGLFHVKGIPFVAVEQVAGGENAELASWTGVRNAPVVVYNDEKPIDRWLDIIMLADRIEPEPALLPEDRADRALVVGIINEIAGPGGMAHWHRQKLLKASRAREGEAPDPFQRLQAEYNANDTDAARAPYLIAAILNMLAARLKKQRDKGSIYLVGTTLTAADIYWATFSLTVVPLPEHVNPMPEHLRKLYSQTGPIIDSAKDPILFEHRAAIYERHLKLPLDF